MTVDEEVDVRGWIDADGRLVRADERLVRLNLGAGGQEGGQLIVPQLASIARMAKSLGVLVSRAAVVAEAGRVLDLWAKAWPEEGGVALSLTGWEERYVTGNAALHSARARDFAELESEGSWECDAGLDLVKVNPALAAIIDGHDADMRETRLHRLFQLAEDAEGDVPLIAAMAEKSHFSGQVARLRAAPDVELLLHGAPVTDAEGRFAGFRGGFSRLGGTDREAGSSDRLPPLPDDLPRRLDAALRSPLQRIVANADGISQQGGAPLRQNYAGYARDIAAAGRHLLALVDDLNDVQAIERGDFAIQPEPVDLADVARRAAGLLRVRAQDKQVRIQPPAEDERLPVLGDFSRILQILVNLIGNAVRYSPPDSMVWVRAEEEEDLIALVVADQGKGIDPADHGRIFEKFERVDQSEPGGSGLGLYISRRLARAMGGDITVDSAPGFGARFVLTLPRA